MNDENMTRLIPGGLATVLVNGVQKRIDALSPEKLAIESADPIGWPCHLTLCIYSFCSAGFQEIPLTDVRLLSSDQSVWSRIYTFSIQDAAYRQAVSALCKDYVRYVRLVEEDSVSQTLVGYPDESSQHFPATLDDARREWFSGLDFSLDVPFELSMSIDRPSLYERFLNTDAQSLFRELLQESHLHTHSLFLHPITRIYLGNSFCHNLPPQTDRLRFLMEHAYSQGLSITLVFPYLRQSELDKTHKVLEIISDLPCELVINDWGLLSLCQEHGLNHPLCMGPLLNRRRKDPRLKWQNGHARFGSLLAENSLNDPEYLSFLQKQGFSRFEHETCGYPISLPPQGNHSLHLPWYQTNTSQYCPLHALCHSGDRRKQTLVSSCEYPCEQLWLGYPSPPAMAGMFNSLFAPDIEALSAPERISTALSQGVDRLVMEWL